MQPLKCALIALAIAVSFVSFSVAQQPQPQFQMDPSANELLVEHNRMRATLGWNKPCLNLDPQLCWAAQNKAQEMARTGWRNPPGANHAPYHVRLVAVAKSGYPVADTTENVGVGYQDAKAASYGWWNSSGHRAAIVGNWRDVGFGMARDQQGRPFWCAIFANRKNSACATGNCSKQPAPQYQQLPSPK